MKRSHGETSDPQGSDSDRVDSGISLLDSLQDSPTFALDLEGFEDSELGELEGPIVSGSFDFVEPTPKSAPKDDRKKPRVVIEDLDDIQDSACESGPASSPAVKFNQETMQKNSLDVTSFKMFKQPWEKGAMGKLFGGQHSFGRQVPSLGAGGISGWSVKLGWKQHSIESTTIEEVAQPPSTAIFLKVVKVAPERDYFEERESKRLQAVAQLWSLISISLSDSEVGRQVLAESTLETYDQYGKELLEATFGLKSPNTLLKRFYALKAYATWCAEERTSSWLPIVETAVWGYMRWLKATDAPPTRATRRGAEQLAPQRNCFTDVHQEEALETSSSSGSKGGHSHSSVSAG